MRGEVSWQVELTVKPGELDNFRALTREMVESTKGEPGVLIYERFISEDGKVVSAYERYADSAAAVAHLLDLLGSFRRFLTGPIGDAAGFCFAGVVPAPAMPGVCLRTVPSGAPR